MMDKYFFIAATLVLTVFAQLVLKSRALLHAQPGAGGRLGYLIAMYTDIRVLAMFGCAVLASVCWALALQRVPLTVAYPFQALSFVFVPLASVILFHESMSWLQVVSVGLIVLGVALSAAPG